MKKHLILSVLFIAFSVFAQAQTKTVSPQKTVELFFKAFHEKDTNAMRSLTYESFDLKSISKDELGTTEITIEPLVDFLKAIASISEKMAFKEKIHAYQVKTDGALAHVWTPYSFFVNGKLSHCGVNSFQLFKKEGDWKIISIVDTRQKDCGD